VPRFACNSPQKHRLWLSQARCVVSALALALGFPACERCDRREPSPPSAANNSPASSPHASRFDLDGLKVQAQFGGYRLLEEQSDPATGLLAFAAERPATDRTASLFLDGSRSVTLPQSPEEALASVIADDACKAAGACTELSHMVLPNQGLLVSVRKPHSIYTEVWRKNAQERVVRCGAELSELGAANPSDQRWLDDDAKVHEAQLANEALCRGVTPLP
jgi:hypothetical protein